MLRGVARRIDEAAELRHHPRLVPDFLRKLAMRHVDRPFALVDRMPCGNLQCPTVHWYAVLFDERDPAVFRQSYHAN